MASSVHTLMGALRDAVAVDGTHYDLSEAGRVQLGQVWSPPLDGPYVTIAGGDLASTSPVDVLRWTYRCTLIVQGWAPATGEDRDRLRAASELRSDVLAALHGALVDPSARTAAARAVTARDFQVSSTIIDTELMDAMPGGWGYMAIELSFTVDGDPGGL